MAHLDDLIAAKREFSRRLLRATAQRGALAGLRATSISSLVKHIRRNLHAVGLGLKLVDGRPTGELCIRFYVAQKLGVSLLPPRDMLPRTIDGLMTDVVECPPAYFWAKRKSLRGTDRAGATRATSSRRGDGRRAAPPPSPPAVAAAANCTLGRRSQQRPVYPGISIAHHDVTAGTLACFCQSLRNGDNPQQLYLLSNNHVLANLNAGHTGDEVLQPGPADGGISTSRIAELTRFAPLALDGITANQVDCAIAALAPNVAHRLEICEVGRVTGVKLPEIGMIVRKHGRTTGYTQGVITDIHYDAIVGLDANSPALTARFEDQIRIEAVPEYPVVGLGGDSGSLMVERDSQQAVGLYFAGPPNGAYGIANHISDVLSMLEITLA